MFVENNKGKDSKLSEFEGLRGIAAFIVLIAHIRLTFFADSNDQLWEMFSPVPLVLKVMILSVIKAFHDGTFAVWIFWVMSAFVLSYQFFKLNRDNDLAGSRYYLKEATVRRYPRLLLPVLASVIFAFIIHSFG